MRVRLVVAVLGLVALAACSRDEGRPDDPRLAGDAATGRRLYGDICARCHGEAGLGLPPGVPALRDSRVRLATSPLGILRQILAPPPDSAMPDFGARLTPDEIVAVVNHLRSSWDSDHPPIELRDPVPPAAISDLEGRYARALKRQDLDALMACYRPDEAARLHHVVRAARIDACGIAAIRRTWAHTFESERTDQRTLARHAFPGARYATCVGPAVVAAGGLFLEWTDEAGGMDRQTGRFLRVYEEMGGEWRLSLDFAVLADTDAPPRR